MCTTLPAAGSQSPPSHRPQGGLFLLFLSAPCRLPRRQGAAIPATYHAQNQGDPRIDARSLITRDPWVSTTTRRLERTQIHGHRHHLEAGGWGPWRKKRPLRNRLPPCNGFGEVQQGGETVSLWSPNWFGRLQDGSDPGEQCEQLAFVEEPHDLLRDSSLLSPPSACTTSVAHSRLARIGHLAYVLLSRWLVLWSIHPATSCWGDAMAG